MGNKFACRHPDFEHHDLKEEFLLRTYRHTGTKKWIAATLAFGVAFGGTWIAPDLGSTAHAASAQPAGWNTAERMALAKTLAMADKAADDFYSDPGNARYLAVRTASDKARTLLLDANPSPSKLNASRSALDSALTAYIEDYIRDSSILERQTFQTARMLSASTGTAPGMYPQEAADAMMIVIAEAQAVAYDPNASVEQFREAYRKYIEGSAVLCDRMNVDRSERLTALNAQRQAAEQSALGAAGSRDVEKWLNDFRAQANEMESVLTGASGALSLDAAARNVQTAYDCLVEGVQLDSELNEARKLLDSPKGIRSGQYPSSAVGELRKVINKHALTLSRTSTQAQLQDARTSLAEAVAQFRSTLNP